jgi:uncharacterized protein
MEWIANGTEIFVRLDPGEGIVESLRNVAQQVDFSAAAITSGVGMLNGVELGFFDVGIDDYINTVVEGVYDLSSVLGNITRRDAVHVPHVHVVFNDTKHTTYSGHVIEAKCHITVEIFLSLTVSALQRVKIPGCPATRIIRSA